MDYREDKWNSLHPFLLSYTLPSIFPCYFTSILPTYLPSFLCTFLSTFLPFFNPTFLPDVFSSFNLNCYFLPTRACTNSVFGVVIDPILDKITVSDIRIYRSNFPIRSSSSSRHLWPQCNDIPEREPRVAAAGVM